ncbi:ParB N-terminal domain-containing protein [Mameliella alba]|nr:ParB N-terminal domain-containing protein [Antarctobacter heliothermus]MBY6147149.1 ParB N-terminal domain-containing protein [Mameliella alba]MCA0957214.1 ParB N-terminal domain-containing protein [Mameliella alba]
MAKRKRLTPANPMFLEPAPEVKSAVSAPARAPIADVAREASATAAAEELARQMAQARVQGRMVIPVSLSEVRRDYLVRDRIAVDEEEMAVLVESLRARGQQTPVELVDLGPETGGPRYGLISGWRRCMALERLHAETGEPRFAEVLGLLRRPEDSSGAYVAMIEENEIRVGLSYYERARIVVRAVEAGAFADETAALRALFASASRAKRSKIGSFTRIVSALEGILRFPQALGERQGLALAQALEADPSLVTRLAAQLRDKPADSAEAELAVLRQAMTPKRPDRSAVRPKPDGACVRVERRAKGEIVLRADDLDAGFLADLRAWLAARAG